MLAPCARGININAQILALYLGHILPGIAQPGDDNNFGSSALADVLALQVGGPAALPQSRGPSSFPAGLAAVEDCAGCCI